MKNTLLLIGVSITVSLLVLIHLFYTRTFLNLAVFLNQLITVLIFCGFIVLGEKIKSNRIKLNAIILTVYNLLVTIIFFLNQIGNLAYLIIIAGFLSYIFIGALAIQIYELKKLYGQLALLSAYSLFWPLGNIFKHAIIFEGVLFSVFLSIIARFIIGIFFIKIGLKISK